MLCPSTICRFTTPTIVLVLVEARVPARPSYSL
jgi:hypothetical protein